LTYQRDIERHFADRINLYRYKNTADNFGGDSQLEEKIEIDLPCRIYATAGLRQVQVEGKLFLPVKRLMVARDIDIKTGDRVEVQEESYVVISKDVKRMGNQIDHIACVLATEQR